MKNFSLILLTFSLIIISCSSYSGEYTAEERVRQDVEWLASDERGGRLAGTVHEAEAANYIADRYLQVGLLPAGDSDTYFQQYLLEGPLAQSMNVERHLSRNVVGLIEGAEQPGQYVIIGAHYDGQGFGGAISMNHENPDTLHNSADDNASGVAGLLRLAEQFSDEPPAKSILFVAFSGEEVGLQGSRYFARNLEVEADSVLAMINLDMIGRLNDDELTIFGTGTSPMWDEILTDIEIENVEILSNPSGTGASDHSSFHEISIPALHYFTGSHEDYHRGSDTSDKIDMHGILKITNHAEKVVRSLFDLNASEIEFTPTAPQRESTMDFNSVTLGVIPDYSYSGDGFRVESIRADGPAERSGMEPGDVIIQMGDKPIQDIYDYMDSLADFSKGEEIVVKVRRSEEIVEITVTF